MATVASLEAQLTIEVRQFQSNVNAAARTFEDGAKRIEQASSRTSKAVSKLQQFIGQGMKAAVGIGLGTIMLRGAANIRNVAKAAVMGAGRIEQMDAVLVQIGKTAGWTAKEISNQVQGIRDAGIEYGIAQRTLQDFIRYELDVAKATDLARVAQDAAVLSNSNSSATLERLIYGISTQNSLILRNAGLQVQAGQAMGDYADSLGIAQDQLTGSQRTQAVFNAVLKEGTQINGAYETSLKNPIKQLGSLKRVQDDVANNLGKAFYPVLVSVVNNGLTPFWKSLSKATEEGSSFNRAMSDLGQDVADVIDTLIEWAQGPGGEAFADIASSILDIAKQLSVFSLLFKETEALDKALAATATSLKIIAQILERISPLVQGWVVLKVFNRLNRTTTVLADGTKVLGTHTAALTTRMAALSGSLRGAAASGTLMSSSLTAMKGAARGLLTKLAPLAAAWAAFEVGKGVLRLFTDETWDAEEAQRSLGRVIDGNVESIKEYQDAVRDWLTTSSDSSFSGNIIEPGAFDVSWDDWIPGEEWVNNAIDGLFGTSLFQEGKALNDVFDEWADKAKVSRQAIDSLTISFLEGRTTTDEYRATIERLTGLDMDESAIAALNKQANALRDTLRDDFVGRLLSQSTDLATLDFGLRQLDIDPQLAGLRVDPRLPQVELSDSGRVAAEQAITEAINGQYLSYQDLLTALEATLAYEVENKRLSEEAAAAILAEAEAVQTLTEKLDASSGGFRAVQKNLVDIAKASQAWVDTLEEVRSGELSAADATGALVAQMSTLVDAALATAEAQAQAAEGGYDAANAEAIFKEEVERSIGPLLEAAAAAGLHVDKLRAVLETLTDLDGKVAQAAVQISLKVGGDLDTLKELQSFLIDMSTSDIFPTDYTTEIRAVTALIASLESAGQAIKLGPDGDRSSGRAKAPEPTYGGMTKAQWDEIAEAMERANNAGREAAGATSQGVGIIVGALRAQKTYNDLVQDAADLQEERSNLVGGEIAEQEKLVETLKAKAAAITAAEQVGIESAANSLRGARRQFNVGLITAAELKVAEEKLAEAKKAATGPTAELESAEQKLLTMKERLLTIDEQITENAWAQVEAQAALGVAFAEVAANVDLVREAMSKVDLSNIPGAQEFIDSVQATGGAAAQFNVGGLVGLTRGDAFTQIAKSLGFSPVNQGDAFNLLAQLGIVGIGSAANLGSTFTAEQAELVQGRIGNNSASITIYAGMGTDPTALGDALVEALKQWTDTNGPIPISVSTGPTAGAS